MYPVVQTCKFEMEQESNKKAKSGIKSSQTGSKIREFKDVQTCARPISEQEAKSVEEAEQNRIETRAKSGNKIRTGSKIATMFKSVILGLEINTWTGGIMVGAALVLAWNRRWGEGELEFALRETGPCVKSASSWSGEGLKRWRSEAPKKKEHWGWSWRRLVVVDGGWTVGIGDGAEIGVSDSWWGRLVRSWSGEG